MKKNNIISVIVPVYNSENYLKKCIDSLINQTYKNIEILLIDDGSTDNSGKICSEYTKSDSRIKYYKKKNAGVSAARNYGLEKATGDYISFVDSDDWLDEIAYENCMEIVVKENADILRFSHVKEYGKISRPYRYVVPIDKLIKKNEYMELLYPKILSTYDLSNSCGCIFKKSLLHNISFDKNIKNGEDFKFMFDIFLNSKSIYFIDKPFYHYYYNVSSATNSINIDKLLKKIEDNINVCKYILNKLPDEEKYRNQMNERIISMILSIQSQASYLSYNEYFNFLIMIQEILQKEKLIYDINKSYLNYWLIKLKNNIKNIIKKIV